MENNSSCNFYLSVYLWVDSTQVVANSFGILSSLTAIVLVLITRAYKEFIQRLFLYLAITATFLCTLLLSFPIVSLAALYDNTTFNSNSKAKIDFQIAISFPLGYFGLLYALLLCWIGVYVASLTMGTAKIFNSTRREVIGLAIVTIIPLTLAWIIPVIQTYAYETCRFTPCLLSLIGVIVILMLLSVLIDTFAIGAVIFQLCHSGLKLDGDIHIRRSLKKAAPLLALGVLHQIASGFMLIYTYLLLMNDNSELPLFLVLLFWLLPFSYISILLVLLCQPRIRHGIKCKKKKRQQQQSEGACGANTGSGIQDVTSQTHYIHCTT